jgi:predicted enzyme related to lactoylglutathione lyase
MTPSIRVFSSFSVLSIKKSKAFYEYILDFQTEETFMGVLHLITEGNEPIVLYEKKNHEPASFTVLNISVESLEQTVDALIKKGIDFEQYGGEYIATNEKGISDQGSGPKMAWLKDPSGNVIALMEE